MAFLDNSGDIILDAVLTDTGRMRLARGDGSFRIAKFALGDDEINYSSYNKDHASGSAYFDLDVLSTPVLEAFTDNGAMMKSKLLSIPRTNLLYLPTIKLKRHGDNNINETTGSYMCAVDESTEDSFLSSDIAGILRGYRPTGGRSVITHQGLDTTEIPPTFNLDADLVETQYIVEVDNRLCSVCDKDGRVTSVSFIDDDNIASYYFSQGTDRLIVYPNTGTDPGGSTTDEQPIAGPRGTNLRIKLKASLELNTSTFLFTRLGGTAVMDDKNGTSTSIRYIDTNIRITGATTGYRVDIPMRFIKKV